MIGELGKPGKDYYSDISVLVTKDEADTDDIIWLQGVKWNEDTEILGDSDPIKTDTQTGLMGDVRIKGSDFCGVLDRNTYWTGQNSAYYDLTKVCQNSGSVTFTNVTTDSNGHKIDMTIRFSPFSVLPDTAIGDDASNLLMLFRAPDQSFEFNQNSRIVTKLNLSEISFSYNDDKEHKPIHAGVVMMASDIDGGQSIHTDFGNQMTYVDPDSNVFQDGDTFGIVDLTRNNLDGLNSSPEGTVILVGIGQNFFYNFNQETVENARKNATGAGDWDNQLNVFSRGFWLNLFGNTTTMNIVSKPVPPQYLGYLPLIAMPKPDTPKTPDKPKTPDHQKTPATPKTPEEPKQTPEAQTPVMMTYNTPHTGVAVGSIAASRPEGFLSS